MLARIISKNTILKRAFSIKATSIKNILKQEIDHEEKSYTPVDKAEMSTFFKNSGFNFTEKENSYRMELTKTDEYEVIVNFLAKPPMEVEENSENQGIII
jgi:hypothetical protein